MRNRLMVGLASLAAMATLPTLAAVIPDSTATAVVVDTVVTPDDDKTSAAPILTPDDWDETATKTYYNSALRLAWAHEMGDHADTVLGTATIAQSTAPARVAISVSGNDFFIGCGAGTTIFASRESLNPALRPTLVVNGGRTYRATRDTYLHASTAMPLGQSGILACRNSVLIAFDDYIPQNHDRAVLQLSPIKTYGTQIVSVYAPRIVQPSIDIPSIPATRTIAEFTAKQFKPVANLTIGDSFVTGSLTESQSLTFINQVFKVPLATEYYLTVVMRLDGDWPDVGGKFPGLANTGISNTPAIPTNINGVDCRNAGWGERAANGCRWSARTGWNRRQANRVAAGSYYYALNTGDFWGKSIPMISPWEIGKWFAYVERVKLNDVGQANGLLSYWRCSDQGCGTQFQKNDIRWRNTDIAQSNISEVWADVYCGGLKCPRNTSNSTSASIKRLTVTDGLPDLNAISAEVRALNKGLQSPIAERRSLSAISGGNL